MRLLTEDTDGALESVCAIDPIGTLAALSDAELVAQLDQTRKTYAA